MTGISAQDFEAGEHGMFTFPDDTALTDALTPHALQPCIDNAHSFHDTQARVASIIADKIIVGHTLWSDLSGALLLSLFSRTSLTDPPSLPLVILIRI